MIFHLFCIFVKKYVCSTIQPWDKEELDRMTPTKREQVLKVVMDKNYGDVEEEFSSSTENSDDFVYLPNDDK